MHRGPPMRRKWILLLLTLVTAAAQASPGRRAPLTRHYKKEAPPLPATHIVQLGVIPARRGGAQHGLLAQKEYEDLRNASKELLTRFPPENSFFVGLGRDP